jgi:putative ABC transport system permease protein
VSALAAELRAALRRLRRAPGVAAVAVLTLAVGIGATAAVFTVVDHVLLRPLAYRDAGRLVALFAHETRKGERRNPTSPADFEEWRRSARSLESLTAAHPWSPVLTDGDQPEALTGLKATPALFELLGASPRLGRAFREGSPDGQVVLSHELWARRFASDPGIVGRPLTLDGRSYVVSAVMPPGFRFPPFWATGAELWVPLVFDEARQGSHAGFLRVFGRLRPGATLAGARAEMDVVARRLAASWPRTNATLAVNVEPLQEPVVGRARPALLLLAGAGALVLSIACANVANLLLAQGLARAREAAVRSALGASRGRLAKQWLLEALAIAVPAGLLGLLLARAGVLLLVRHAPSGLPRLDEVTVDARVTAFALALAVVTALLSGLLPAMRASGGDIVTVLKAGERGAVGSARHRLHDALVVAEVAMAVVLLVGAGLLAQSFLRLQRPDPGFRPQGVLTVALSLSSSPQADGERRAALLEAALARVRSVPGVESAAFVNHVPIAGDTWRTSFTVEGRPAADDADPPAAVLRTATAGYLRAMGIALVSGRGFEARDRAGAEPVVLVNESFVRRHLAGGDPLGARVRLGRAEEQGPWRRVVGVVGDARQSGLVEPIQPEIVFPYGQDPVAWFDGTTLVVRTAGEPRALADVVVAQLRAVAPELPLPRVRTMGEVLAEAIRQDRFQTLLLGVLAAVALLLAAVGIHAVMAYAVGRRTHEIGVRMALGARAEGVLAMVVRDALRLAAAGATAGLLGAVAASRLLRGVLHEVSPTDPATFAGAALALVAVALAASLAPALRAARVDPLVALREG